MPIATINSAMRERIKTFEPLTSDQIEEKIQRAVSGFDAHRRTSFVDHASPRRMMVVINELRAILGPVSGHSLSLIC